jgi:aminopeptidase-like protein
LVTPVGLGESLDVLKDCIQLVEYNEIPVCKIFCEPQLGKRGLYPNTSTRTSGLAMKNLTNLIAYSDGKRDLVEIAEHIGESAIELIPILQRLKVEEILESKH